MAVFSDLPEELRLKIWKMVPVSRNVVLSPHPNGYIKIRTQLLAVWRVCSEARTATLRAYTKIDCSQVVSQTKTMSIYIDFNLDRIIFKTGFDGSSRLCSFEVLEKFLGEYLIRIRRCAISVNFDPFPAAALRNIRLQELCIVGKGPEDSCHELSNLTIWRDQIDYRSTASYQPHRGFNDFTPSFFDHWPSFVEDTRTDAVLAYKEASRYDPFLYPVCKSIYTAEWNNKGKSEDNAMDYTVVVKRSGNKIVAELIKAMIKLSLYLFYFLRRRFGLVH
jgi:hypothetical protein